MFYELYLKYNNVTWLLTFAFFKDWWHNRLYSYRLFLVFLNLKFSWYIWSQFLTDILHILYVCIYVCRFTSFITTVIWWKPITITKETDYDYDDYDDDPGIKCTKLAWYSMLQSAAQRESVLLECRLVDLVGEEKRLTFSQNEITWTCFQLALSSTYP